MIEKIIETYTDFHDAVISSITYEDSGKPKFQTHVTLTITCMNLKNGNVWEIIKLKFFDVQKFRFTEEKFGSSSRCIFNALFLIKNDEIIVDFFPLMISHDKYEVDENSNLLIVSKKVEYEVVV